MSRYIDIVNKGRQMLEEAEIDDFAIDAWLLFEHIFRMNRTAYFLHQPDENKDLQLENEYFEAIKRRCKRIPLQHITGYQEFMGFKFYVNENTLVPRQDTEILVEAAMDTIESEFDTAQKVEILDMCTGTGCIGISLAKLVPDISVLAADISEEALKVAQRNKDSNNADNVEFVKGDLFEAVDTDKRFKLIVSNPPYIRTKDIETLKEEVKLHDPFIALDGMEDGLYFYRKITKGAAQRLENGGYLMYEIGFDQAAEVSLIMEKAGFSQIRVIKDLAGLDRVVTGRLCRKRLADT